MNPADRFFRHVEPSSTGCLIWIGHRSKDGYGQFGFNGRVVKAHRWLLERVLPEPIAPHLVVDHLCRNRACVLPSHLEFVTRAENNRRSPLINLAQKSKTHCPQGHPYDETNTYLRDGKRSCKTCRAERVRATPRDVRAAYARAYRARAKAKSQAEGICRTTVALLQARGLRVLGSRSCRVAMVTPTCAEANS